MSIAQALPRGPVIVLNGNASRTQCPGPSFWLLTCADSCLPVCHHQPTCRPSHFTWFGLFIGIGGQDPLTSEVIQKSDLVQYFLALHMSLGELDTGAAFRLNVSRKFTSRWQWWSWRLLAQ